MIKELQNLAESLKKLEKDRFKEILDKVIKECNPQEIFDQVFVPTMAEIRARCHNDEIAIPELLLSMELMMELLATLDMKQVKREDAHNKKIVLGVIEGDPHDIGKNIVRRVYDCYGFQVYDVGKDVLAPKFAEKAAEVSADIVGISTMMSTTIDKVSQAIQIVKKTNPGIKVIVGGAFITPQVAMSIGADGYAESAGDLIEQTDKMFVDS